MHGKIPPNAAGILRCLQALAEETESLKLTQTNLALQQAIIVCRAEGRLPLSITPPAHSGRFH